MVPYQAVGQLAAEHGVPVVRTLWAAAIALAIFASPASAQFKTGTEKSGVELQDEQRQKALKEIDKDYQETMKRTRTRSPAATTSADPWRGTRSSDPDKNKR